MFGFDAPYASLQRTFAKDKGSRAALAGDPRRAFDIMSLPLPVGGVSVVVAFFDQREKLDQILVLYKPGLAEGYKDAEHIYRLLHDRGLESKPGEDSLGIVAKVCQIGKIRCEAAIMPRSTAVGGFVNLGTANARNAPYRLERSFGAASLDRGFEQNRLRLVPQQRKNVVSTQEAQALALVINPLPALNLAATRHRTGSRAGTDCRLRIRLCGRGVEARALLRHAHAFLVAPRIRTVQRCGR